MTQKATIGARAVALGIGITLALAGCSGGGESEGTPAEPSGPTGAATASATESGAAETSAAQESVPGAELAQRMLTAMTESKTAKFSGETVGGPSASTTEGVLLIDEQGVASRATTTVPDGQQVEIILFTNEAFISLGDTGDGKPWLRLDPNSDDPTAAALGTLIDQLRSAADPRSSVAVYEQAGDFTVEGTEEVDGVETTRYSGALPPEAVLTQVPEELREQVRPLLGTEPFPVQIWLDGGDRPVRFVQEATIDGQASTTTQDYREWGQAVTIEPPPADQVR